MQTEDGPKYVLLTTRTERDKMVGQIPMRTELAKNSLYVQP